MKSYRTKNSFHMVGQAWQIRIMLQQWMKETPPLTPLATLLNDPRRNGNGEVK